MGYTTDFIGHIDINPSLNDDEVRYLLGFAHTRHFRREEGQYAVPGNPIAEDGEGIEIDRYNTVHPRQPSFWCDWQPCWDGCCITWSGAEKFYNAVPWLEYVIEHFLRPGAWAEASGLPCFEGFTFDHRADGVIAACRRDNKELSLIRVEDNRVTEEIVRPADSRFLDFPPLAYEEVIDRWEGRRKRRRSRRGGSA